MKGAKKALFNELEFSIRGQAVKNLFSTCVVPFFGSYVPFNVLNCKSAYVSILFLRRIIFLSDAMGRFPNIVGLFA